MMSEYKGIGIGKFIMETSNEDFNIPHLHFILLKEKNEDIQALNLEFGLVCSGHVGEEEFVIENLAQLKTAAFDKTGTITKGSFAVTDVLTGEGEDKDSVLLVAAAAECASTHPIAVSIRKACKEEPDASSVTDIKEIAGKGISAIFNNEQVL